MNILITGGAGSLGMNLLNFLSKKKTIFLLLIILPREIEKLSNLSQIILL